MKKLLFKLLSLILFVGFMQSCEKTFDEEISSDEIELKSANSSKTSYIVVLNDAELNLELSQLKGYEKKQAAVKSASAKILKRAGIFDGEVEHVYGTALKGFSVKIPPGQLKKLQDDPSISFIEKDQVATLIFPDLKIKKKPVLPPDPEPDPTQEVPWGITRVNGGGEFTGKNTAWILDSGIDLDHPDLNVDESRSVTFVRSKSADDDNGHGSHVAGTVGAIDNEIGVVGVAPNATLVAVKVLDRRGSGSYSGVIAGINYVAANASIGDVANMSLGGPTSDALDAAVIAAAESGIKFALAAGNESDDASNHSPARANHANIYTVSAMWEGDRFATEFSNYGNPPVDYAAPGVNILSTYKNGGYETLHGTSMAAPHVAGILLWGNITSDGNVTSDPDGNPDPIASH